MIIYFIFIDHLSLFLKKKCFCCLGEHNACGLWCKNDKKDYEPGNLPYGTFVNH